MWKDQLKREATELRLKKKRCMKSRFSGDSFIHVLKMYTRGNG
jgi:hypothetical protein